MTVNWKMFCWSVLCKIPCYLLQPKKSMPWKYLIWKQLTNALAKDSFWKKLTEGFGQRPVTDLTGCSVGAHHPEKWFQRQRSWVKGVAISHGDPTPGLYQLDLENMCGSVGLRVAWLLFQTRICLTTPHQKVEKIWMLTKTALTCWKFESKVRYLKWFVWGSCQPLPIPYFYWMNVAGCRIQFWDYGALQSCEFLFDNPQPNSKCGTVLVKCWKASLLLCVWIVLRPGSGAVCCRKKGLNHVFSWWASCHWVTISL